MLGILAVALLALGVLATSATAAKPKLWLTHLNTGERASPGQSATVLVTIEQRCQVTQGGSLASNGKAKDKVTVEPGEDVAECGAEKVGGSIVGVSLAPVGTEEAAITVKTQLHEFEAPWCSYALPKTVTLPPSSLTSSETVVPAPLDKRGSHGSCAPIRQMTMAVTVDDPMTTLPFLVEVD